jgi:hypothetical protein
MRNLFAGLLLLGFSTAALAQTATVPNTFTAGAQAKASEVNANFAALVTAINAVGTRVAALESANSALVAADVVGSYRLLSIASTTGSLASTKRFASKSGTNNGTVTFNSNGTLNVVKDSKSDSFSGKAQDCASGAADTSATNAGGGPHVHQYTAANCNQTAAVFSSQAADNLGQTGSGTWALGAAANTVTITMSDGTAPFTVYMPKRDGLGFSVTADANNDPSNPGREFSLSVLVKQ